MRGTRGNTLVEACVDPTRVCTAVVGILTPQASTRRALARRFGQVLAGIHLDNLGATGGALKPPNAQASVATRALTHAWRAALYDSGTLLSIGVELLAVGIVAARFRIHTFVLALIVAAIALTWFNATSPFRASYLSEFSLTVFLSWLIYIWLVRLIFRRSPKALP